MADKPIDHDIPSGVATVAGGVAKGAAAGVGALALAAVGAVALVAAIGFAAVTAGWGAALAVGAVGALAYATSEVWIPFAIGGAAIGAVSGANKVDKEQQAFNARAQGHQASVQDSLQAAHQQGLQAGYEAGTQAGADAVLNRLQEVAMQQQQMEAAAMQQHQAVAHQAPAPAPMETAHIQAEHHVHPSGEQHTKIAAHVQQHADHPSHNIGDAHFAASAAQLAPQQAMGA